MCIGFSAAVQSANITKTISALEMITAKKKKKATRETDSGHISKLPRSQLHLQHIIAIVFSMCTLSIHLLSVLPCGWTVGSGKVDGRLDTLLAQALERPGNLPSGPSAPGKQTLKVRNIIIHCTLSSTQKVLHFTSVTVTYDISI